MEQEHSTLEDGTTASVDDTAPTGDPGATSTASAWIRPARGRLLAGVAAGIAMRLHIPVWLVRAAFVIAAFANGFGVLAYLVAWALMPEEGSTRTVADDLGQKLKAIDQPSKVVGAVLIGLGSLIALGSTGLLSSPMTTALVLAGLGFFLIRKTD